MGALNDLRVLDLSHDVAGPFCGKMLGDLGAAVIKVEPVEGESGRALPPLIEGRQGPEASAFFQYLNTSKRGITLDLDRSEGIRVLQQLVRSADIVVESYAPGALTAMGLGYDRLEALHPGVILTSITPFGQDGPWRDLPINDLLAYAISGWASVNGRPDGAPLKGSGFQASFQAGVAAYIATMAAVVHRDRSGVGQQVDISVLDPVIASFAPALASSQYDGRPSDRRPATFQSGPVRSADGYFALTLSRAHFWRDAMIELGLPQYAHDERFYESTYRQAHTAEISSEVEARIAARGKQDLFDAMSLRRVVSGMVLTTQELFENPHVRERGYFTSVTHPDSGTLEQPGAPFKLSATPWQASRPAPQLGEHTEVVLAEAGFDAGEIARLRESGVI